MPCWPTVSCLPVTPLGAPPQTHHPCPTLGGLRLTTTPLVCRTTMVSASIANDDSWSWGDEAAGWPPTGKPA